MFKFIRKKYNLFIIRQYWKLFNKRPNAYYKKSYSQDGEDMIVASFYDSNPHYKGFYVDIGAHHPFRYSNTQFFYEKGWRGINIDATPGSMDRFKDFRPEDINLEIGISTVKGEIEFFMFESPALNTFDKNLAEEYKKINPLTGIKIVQTYTINEVLDKYLPEGKKIDFMNIDIEGLDFDIIKSLNWEKYSPDFIMIEELNFIDCDILKMNQGSELIDYLSEKGYIPTAKAKRTIIFKKVNSVLTL